MIYDLMPVWLRKLLRMETAILPTESWTWRHICRYGSNPAFTMNDFRRWKEKEKTRDRR